MHTECNLNTICALSSAAGEHNAVRERGCFPGYSTGVCVELISPRAGEVSETLRALQILIEAVLECSAKRSCTFYVSWNDFRLSADINSYDNSN